MALGKVFAPLAFLIGVSWDEATVAGSFIGQKLIVNELWLIELQVLHQR